MKITPYTNLTSEELEECKKLASYNAIITLEKPDGEIFYIVSTSKLQAGLPKGRAVFLPSELIYLNKIQDPEYREKIFMIKRFGGRLIYSGPPLKEPDPEPTSNDWESMREKRDDLKKAKKGAKNGLQKLR